MSTMKKCQVVMLPTKEKVNECPILYFPKTERLNKRAYSDKELQAGKGLVNLEYSTNHLYITSDDEIKEEDWFMSAFFSYPIHNIKELREREGGLGWTTTDLNKDFRGHKIIATTDSSLTKKIGIGTNEDQLSVPINYEEVQELFEEVSLPQPSQSFIEKYVEQYNIGTQITDVLVEYENGYIDNKPVSNGVLKVNPKDNTIAIKKVKESWNRDEVIEILYSSLDATVTSDNRFRSILENQLKDWIEKNL